jgi:DNA-binding CsgD family transcriptional regulator
LAWQGREGSAASSRGALDDRRGDRSAARLSELIGAIYDCVLDPANWKTTLERINREFSLADAALGVFSHRAGAHALNILAGFDQERIDVGDRYSTESVALWGGEEQMRSYPLDEPILGSQATGYPARHTNRYFVEILEPRGLFDGVALVLAREPSLMGYVAFDRHISAGALGETEIGALRLLGPHFRRAVTISNLFDLKAIEASAFTSTLDVFSFAVVLVDENLGIVHANAVARAMLSARDPIRSERGALALPSRDAHGALERAVLQAANDEAAMGPRGIGIPVRRAEGEPCVLHVLPTRRGEVRGGIAPRAVAALFIAPTTQQAKMPADAVALLFDLTPAETRIFELITSGMTQAEAGKHLGVAASTVKTHLLRLFEKTGCKRQVDLIRLAAGLTSPA